MANKKRKQGGQDTSAGLSHRRNESKNAAADWIDALAKEAASVENIVASKAERVERRLAKKQRREERKPASQQRAPSQTSANEGNKHVNNKSNDGLKTELISQTRLLILADRFRTFRERRSTTRLQGTLKRLSKQKPSKAKWNETGIQPRRNDYGGIGLARPSLFLPLNDPSFIPKIEEEFTEHIPGFFGKQRTKAMKKQLNGQMLWRKLAEKRIDNPKLNGRKLACLSPDERVEALLKAGVI